MSGRLHTHSTDYPVHVMIAGDTRDLPAIRGLIARIPDDAYGQIFLEISAAIQIEHLVVPPGVAVNWLPRDASVRAASGLPPRGEMVLASLRGWIAEWLDLDELDHAHFMVWIGCGDVPAVGSFYSEVDSLLHRHTRQG
ncbi:MAG: SIP domain-containing protein [Microbacterium sp.]